MNATQQIDSKSETKTDFLSEKEREDFKIWHENKIRSGSKPYETDGRIN